MQGNVSLIIKNDWYHRREWNALPLQTQTFSSLWYCLKMIRDERCRRIILYERCQIYMLRTGTLSLLLSFLQTPKTTRREIKYNLKTSKVYKSYRDIREGLIIFFVFLLLFFFLCSLEADLFSSTVSLALICLPTSFTAMTCKEPWDIRSDTCCILWLPSIGSIAFFNRLYIHSSADKWMTLCLRFLEKTRPTEKERERTPFISPSVLKPLKESSSWMWSGCKNCFSPGQSSSSSHFIVLLFLSFSVGASSSSLLLQSFWALKVQSLKRVKSDSLLYLRDDCFCRFSLTFMTFSLVDDTSCLSWRSN